QIDLRRGIHLPYEVGGELRRTDEPPAAANGHPFDHDRHYPPRIPHQRAKTHRRDDSADDSLHPYQRRIPAGGSRISEAPFSAEALHDVRLDGVEALVDPPPIE